MDAWRENTVCRPLMLGPQTLMYRVIWNVNLCSGMATWWHASGGTTFGWTKDSPPTMTTFRTRHSAGQEWVNTIVQWIFSECYCSVNDIQIINVVILEVIPWSWLNQLSMSLLIIWIDVPTAGMSEPSLACPPLPLCSYIIHPNFVSCAYIFCLYTVVIIVVVCKSWYNFIVYFLKFHSCLY